MTRGLAFLTFANLLPFKASSVCVSESAGSLEDAGYSGPRAAALFGAGCGDGHSGHAVVAGNPNVITMAGLAAKDFRRETFARYMGQNASAYGCRGFDGSRPVFWFHRIESAVGTCAPRTALQ